MPTEVAAGWCCVLGVDDVFAHHQEHITVTAASGNVHRCCCWLVLRIGCSTQYATPASSNIGEQYQKLQLQ